MKKLMSLAALICLSFGLVTQANALVSGGFIGKGVNAIVFAQEDCNDDETWNEETEKCEKKEQ